MAGRARRWGVNRRATHPGALALGLQRQRAERSRGAAVVGRHHTTDTPRGGSAARSRDWPTPRRRAGAAPLRHPRDLVLTTHCSRAFSARPPSGSARSPPCGSPDRIATGTDATTRQALRARGTKGPSRQGPGRAATARRLRHLDIPVRPPRPPTRKRCGPWGTGRWRTSCTNWRRRRGGAPRRHGGQRGVRLPWPRLQELTRPCPPRQATPRTIFITCQIAAQPAWTDGGFVGVDANVKTIKTYTSSKERPVPTLTTPDSHPACPEAIRAAPAKPRPASPPPTLPRPASRCCRCGRRGLP